MKFKKDTVYDLSDLTKQELQSIKNATFEIKVECKFLCCYDDDKYAFSNDERSYKDSAINAKELFYTLENIQVDVLNSKQEEIKSIIDIYILNKIPYVRRTKKHSYSYIMCNNNSVNEYPTITYDKFMELFTEPQYEVKYISEQPKPEHYSKGIDTFARMEANCTTEECLAFAKGNIDKYNFRTKGQDLEDYKKIVSYANWAISLLNKA